MASALLRQAGMHTAPKSVLSLFGALALDATVARALDSAGAIAYRQHCAPCHGDTGRGDGPDAGVFRPRPRDLRDGILARYATDDLVRSVRDGEPLRLALDPAALDARSREVEAIVAYLLRLPGIDWTLAARGEELYVDRCEDCHGRFGQPGPRRPPGVPHPPPDLSAPALQRALGEARLTDLVRHGHRGMPAVPGVGRDADARAVVAYVRLLSPGFTLYSAYCASCHGEDGHSDTLVDPGLAPTVVFDHKYFAHHDADVLRTRVWHMLGEQRPAMPHFRTRLDGAGVRAIIDYLTHTE